MMLVGICDNEAKLLARSFRGSERVGAHTARHTAMIRKLKSLLKPHNQIEALEPEESTRNVLRKEISDIFAQDLGYARRAS